LPVVKKKLLWRSGRCCNRTRAAPPFHQIDVYDNINVVLTQDTIERIAVEAPQHIEPVITTRIEAGILTLRNEGSCTWLRSPAEKITVYVHLKKLDKILYVGSGHIRSTNTLVSDNMYALQRRRRGNIDLHLDAVQTSRTSWMKCRLCFTWHKRPVLVVHASRGSIDFSDFIVKKW
jgi:hypothetical protein